ncbi:murein L,D-transpeptidase family protein [Nanoarchaeota archaeon]
MERRKFLKTAGLALLTIPVMILGSTSQGNPLGIPPEVYSREDFQRYREWIDQTIDQSRQEKSPAIIIDKWEHTLTLIKTGKVKAEYCIQLGLNPTDDKQKEGDMRTPESLYHIVSREHLGPTSYHKALLLDYPNKDDVRQGKTGSLIEIHGQPRGSPPSPLEESVLPYSCRGIANDWTHGCIALSNPDIDELSQSVGIGTLVTIVKYGTTYPTYLDGTPNIGKFRLEK